MYETSKCYKFRLSAGEFDKYLNGTGIDIGCGPDKLILPNGNKVAGWDVQNGDAVYMSGIEDATFDFAYSSHCLEHLTSVENAISNWTRILKKNGHLYIVIPDYILYEKLTWPSMYNRDHKQSFSTTITREMVKRNNHWNLSQQLMPVFEQNGLQVLEARIEDLGFDYNRGVPDQTLGDALEQICIISKKL